MPKSLTDLRIIFMGTSFFADVILNALLDEKLNIIGVFTQPDKKAGRKQKIQKNAVKITAEKNNLDIYQPERFDEISIGELKDLKPDLIIVAAYGKILPKAVLEIPKFRCLNVHASLLPKYRGPSPIHNVLLNGEKETGVTIMLMNSGIDTGDILSSEKISIHPDDLHSSLSAKLAGLSSSLLIGTLDEWTSGKIQPLKQDDSQATYCQMVKKDDGHVLWSDEAEYIYNKYRAFHFWPGMFSFLDKNGSNLRLKLKKISLGKNNSEKERRLGEVMKIGDKIGVQASEGVIILEEVQLEGKNKSEIKDFINGCPDFVGSILK